MAFPLQQWLYKIVPQCYVIRTFVACLVVFRGRLHCDGEGQ